MDSMPQCPVRPEEDACPVCEARPHHSCPILDISTETWAQRCDRRWEELGTPQWSGKFDEEGRLAIEAAEKARNHADRSMLDEMHLMLRFQTVAFMKLLRGNNGESKR